MDFTRQNARAAAAHGTYLASGEKTCIDCHKGIAHQLPDMKGVPGWDSSAAEPVDPANAKVIEIARELRGLESEAP